jgi:NADH-quinone oxidoreductase subunit A
MHRSMIDLPSMIDAVAILAETSPRYAWLPVLLLIVLGVVFAVGTLAASAVVGPSRTGPGKESTYESGMVPVGDTRKRFNVRFYVLAMIFLVFDVGIILFYPWASIFGAFARSPAVSADLGMGFGTFLLVQAGVLAAILLVAYLYGLGKGVFKFE